MRLTAIATAAAASALLAGAAMAQSTTPGSMHQGHGSMHTQGSTQAQGSMQGSMQTQGTMQGSMQGQSHTMSGSTASGALGADQTGSNVASTGAMAGGVQTVTNGPVADTPENRRMYRPLSNAGRRTAAAGN